MKKRISSFILAIAIILQYVPNVFADNSIDIELTATVGDSFKQKICSVSTDATNLKARTDNIKSGLLTSKVSELKPVIETKGSSYLCYIQYNANKIGSCELEYIVSYSINGKTIEKVYDVDIKITNKKIDDAINNATEKISETADSVANTAKSGYDAASNFVNEQTDKAKEVISELSLPDFKRGFEETAGLFGATVASLGGQAYVQNVANSITALETNISNRVTNGTLSSAAGYIAEEWHAGTYNIDAAVKDLKANASTGKSNGLGSSDVSLSDGTQASLKYYKTAEESAKQQAKNYIERYNQYKSGKTNPKSMDEWLKENNSSIATDSPDLYWSIYKDQVRVIPKEQLAAAKKCLDKAVKSNAAKEGPNRKYVSDADLETLNNLTDRLKSADGTESVPLSKTEAEAIAKSAQEGDFTAADFGISTKTVIKGTYIAKQAIKAGTTSAIIEAALVAGPEIYEIIKYGIESGQIDEVQLKNAGIDGLNAAGDGFLKGSISNALVIMCKAGKLGAQYTNPSPELIGAFTVLVIDAIKYGTMMANGKMSSEEYIDILAEEMLVSAGSLGTAALVQLLFPQATLAILLGSFVGGLVVSAGYPKGKNYVLAVIDSSDVDLLVPIESTAEAVKGVKETASVKVNDVLSNLKNIGAKASDNVTIKVYNLREII